MCENQSLKTDVVIVGTGAAGIFCALNLPDTLSIHMITKDTLENSASYLAQGGIAAMKDADDYDDYFEDTLRAGHYENSRKAVDTMIRQSPLIIQELLAYHVNFDRAGEELSRTKEGGHSQSRILHHDDITGKEITTKLLDSLRTKKNITIAEHTRMVDLIANNNICRGIVVIDQDGNPSVISGKVVVLATGGIGGLFKHSTAFAHITGDALAIASRHHVQLKDVHYIQIHPTALFSSKPGRRFLISEAVRGEGAYLLNASMERFTDELQPRDIVTAAIRDQMQKDGREYVYLSMTHLEPDMVRTRFPNIYRHCLDEGYDLTKEPIPVTPAQHYFMGGIEVDLKGKTSMENLFAIGETSCTGVHGKNRLGSNSLLESLVFAQRAAMEIAQSIPYTPMEEIQVDLVQYENRDFDSEYRTIVLDEIKRRDRDFYEQWIECDDHNG
ncbi:MAG: L-aspartate oxidase [Clostridiales bacterium]|nr:L-aspartate oxidase [Clostridiales bacterium]